MFRKTFFAFLALAAFAVSLPQIAPADESPTDAARTVFKYLKNRDYEVKYDSDGDIILTDEDNLYLILFDKDDKEFFRVIYPFFYTLDDEDEFMAAYIVAHNVNTNVKGVKVLVPEKFIEDPKRIFDAPAISVESFRDDPHEFARSVPRSISAIQTAAMRFVDKMNEVND